MRGKRFRRNNGQTLVEFALVLPVFMIVVIGVLQFGRAITYWLDLNDSAHIAVRYAVTNRYPGCTGKPPGTLPDTCKSLTLLADFQKYAVSNLNSVGLKNNTTVATCYKDTDASGTLTTGDAVRVQLTSPFNIAGLLDIKMVLRGQGTMRMEQSISSTNPTRIGTILTC